MKIGINQPYFFPYIGFWQLMNAVDKYVIADNLHYMKKGFVNRNSILINGEAKSFRVPIQKASQNKLICELEIGLDEAEISKLLNSVKCAYAKAPFFQETYNLIENCLEFGLTDEGKNLGKFLEYSIRRTAEKLGIETTILLASSDVHLDDDYKREHYIVATCKKLEGTEYYNAIGGTKLYCQKFFRENNLGLSFVKANSDIQYKQFKEDEFVPNLSIIDIMMFCSKDEIADLLKQYTLEKGFESF